MEAILGISAFYHDSAAALLIDGEIIAAAQEERFTRKKQDESFPKNSIKYVLAEAGLNINDLDKIIFYDKPFLTFERLLETYHAFAPKGLKSFLTGVPVWLKEKLFMKKLIRESLEEISGNKLNRKTKLLFSEHHLSHAASAFYPSPFEEAAILTVDGVGEWATTTIGHGKDNKITFLKELHFPHSLGLLYSAFTYYCGFKVNSGEYKLMGLAPYGNVKPERVKKIKELIYQDLVDLREDGSFLMNMPYFNYATGLTMCNEGKWHKLFGIPKRSSESEVTEEYMDMALAIQEVTEEIMMRLAETTKKLTGSKNLVMAGGVALNCVVSGKLLRSGLFDDIWIQPAAGDAGGALGAAYVAYYLSNLDKPKKHNPKKYDQMKGSYLGPKFYDDDVIRLNRKYNSICKKENDLYNKVAQLLNEGKVVGWFQGRMEWGPRALGNRSILGNPTHPEMQKKLNLKIKYREGFRPFAPSVLSENADEYFKLNHKSSPYMLLVAPVQEKRCIKSPDNFEQLPLYERLYFLRSDIPAITHIDYSARIQTVHKETNHKYWSVINAFKKLTGIGLVVNTSFNVRGEPIVCTPEDAYRCFMRTEMDYLVIHDFIFAKEDQPNYQDKEKWQEIYELD